MATVGVVCDRVRLEEKQLLAAFAAAGLKPAPFRPGSLPLSLSPSNSIIPRVMIDRGQNRAAAAAVMTASRAKGVITLDAGLAARGDRLTIAATLAAAGLPRPEAHLACSAESALDTLRQFGFPGTVLPLAAGTKPIALLDLDTAEAVLEHRDVLGVRQDSLALVQAGVPVARWSIIVIGGVAVAMTASATAGAMPAPARRLAEAAAATLGAAMVAVEIAQVESGLVIWDVDAVPEFRHATPISDQPVAEALCELALARLAADPDEALTPSLISLDATHRREVPHGVVLTA
jgi:glutathione synthase/RimK-type ligase-like ATP-grasp enzyme